MHRQIFLTNLDFFKDKIENGLAPFLIIIMKKLQKGSGFSDQICSPLRLKKGLEYDGHTNMLRTLSKE